MVTNLFIILVFLCCFFFALWVIERIRREDDIEKMGRLISGHDKVIAKSSLLTENEKKFYHDLQNTFAAKYLIFSQVSLSALVQIKDDQMDKYERRDLISKFYVDFVLCDKQSFKPIMVIELNDKSHQLYNRMERDLYISKMLESAGIKLYPCPSGHLTYEHFMKEIDQRLLEAS